MLLTTLKCYKKLHARILRKRLQLWAESHWVHHQDNAPAHSALATCTFLVKHATTVIEQPRPTRQILHPATFSYSQNEGILKRNSF